MKSVIIILSAFSIIGVNCTCTSSVTDIIEVAQELQDLTVYSMGAGEVEIQVKVELQGQKRIDAIRQAIASKLHRKPWNIEFIEGNDASAPQYTIVESPFSMRLPDDIFERTLVCSRSGNYAIKTLLVPVEKFHFLLEFRADLRIEGANELLAQEINRAVCFGDLIPLKPKLTVSYNTAYKHLGREKHIKINNFREWVTLYKFLLENPSSSYDEAVEFINLSVE